MLGNTLHGTVSPRQICKLFTANVARNTSPRQMLKTLSTAQCLHGRYANFKAGGKQLQNTINK
jgi:hypothetical protein